jgi:hypothetical protein
MWATPSRQADRPSKRWFYGKPHSISNAGQAGTNKKGAAG